MGSLLLLLYLLGLLIFFFVFNVSGPRILKPQNCKGAEYKQYARIHSQHTGHQSVHNESGCSKLPSKSKPVQKVSFATLSHKNSSQRCHTNIIHNVIRQILFTTLSHKYYSQRYHVPRLDAWHCHIWPRFIWAMRCCTELFPLFPLLSRKYHP